MKKIIYSLVIMIAAGSLFTSCIDQIEPVGILDMRTAKAEYIRALKDLRAADAEFRRAQAAHEQANAAYRLAETAWMQEQVENQKLLNEYQALLNEARADSNEVLAAQAALDIQEIMQRMEASAKHHETVMVKLQQDLEKAQYDYDMAVRDLAIASKNLSPEERVALVEAAAIYGAMNELYADSAKKLNAWVAKEANLAEKLKNYNSEKWDGKDMVNKVTYYEEKIAEEKENIKEAQAKMDALPEKDADIEAWATTLQGYKDKVNQMKQALSQAQYDSLVYYNQHIHDGLTAFNEYILAWVEENWETEDGYIYTEPSFVKPTKAQFTTAVDPKIAAPNFIPTDDQDAAWLKFKYLLASYTDLKSPATFKESGTKASPDTKNWDKKIVDVKTGDEDTLVLTASLKMQDFVLGEAGKLAANEYTFKSLKTTKKDTTYKAFYGLAGAVDVLKRDKVLNELAAADTAKAREARDKSQAAWKTDQDTLIAGLAKYKPYVDALAAYKEAQAEEAAGAKSMATAIKTLEEAFGSINSTDLSKNDSIRILNAFKDFAQARQDYLDYTYDKKKQSKDSNMFRFTKGVNAGGAISDSIAFTALTYETLSKGGYDYQYNTTSTSTTLDDYKYPASVTAGRAFANIASQLFGTTVANLLATTAVNTWASTIITEANINADSHSALYNSYEYVAGPPAKINNLDGTPAESKALKAAKQDVKDAVEDYVDVYNRFWATSITAPVSGYDAYFTAYAADPKSEATADALKDAEEAVEGKDTSALKLDAGVYTADTFMKPTNVVTFVKDGKSVDNSNAIDAILGTADRAAQGLTITGGSEYATTTGVIPTTTVIFGDPAGADQPEFYTYMYDEWKYQQSLKNTTAAIAEIEDWVTTVTNKFTLAGESAGTFDEEKYNAAVAKYEAAKEVYEEAVAEFVGVDIDEEGNVTPKDVAWTFVGATDWWVGVDKVENMPIQDVADLFVTNIVGDDKNYVGWNTDMFDEDSDLYEAATTIFGEDAWALLSLHNNKVAYLIDQVKHAEEEAVAAENVFVAAAKCKNLKDENGNPIDESTIAAYQKALEDAYKALVQIYKGDISDAEKAIEEFQKAIVNYQKGLTDLEAEYASVLEKLETAKAEMGVLAEALALAKDNYETVMNYIKTESEGTVIIPVTLQDLDLVYDILGESGFDSLVSKAMNYVTGVLKSLF